MVGSASYIIFKDGDFTCAKNGSTGRIDYKDTDAATVTQDAIDALPDNRGCIHITSGKYSWTKQITVPSKNGIVIEGEGKGTYLDATTTFPYFFRVLKYGIGNTAEIRDMFLDGNGMAGGIGLEGTSWSYINNVNFYFCKPGIQSLTAPVGGDIVATSYIRNIEITEAYTAGIIGRFQDCSWNDIIINGVTNGPGISIADSGRVMIDQLQINTVHQGCIKIYAAFKIFFSNVYIIEDSTQTAYNCVEIGPSVQDISFIGGRIDGGGNSGKSTVFDYGSGTILSNLYLSSGGNASHAIAMGTEAQGTDRTYENIHITTNGYAGFVILPDTGLDTVDFGTTKTVTYQNVTAWSTTDVHAAINGDGTNQTITTDITNPTCPRNLYISCSNVASPSGDVTLTGIDVNGRTVTETVTLNPGTYVSSIYAYVSLTSFVIPEGVGASDHISIGQSNYIGLPDEIRYSWQIFYVKQVGTDALLSFDVNSWATRLNSIHITSVLNGGPLVICYLAMDIAFTGTNGVYA